MAKARKAIITCAVTGAIHTPSMSPYLPVTPQQIIEEAVRAAEAGAAILHIHARDPNTGRPDQSVEAFSRILPEVRKRCDAVVNITTGGSPFMSVAERVEPARHFRPELASLNMGSFNFGLFPMLGRYKEFKHEWEREHLEGSRNLVFRNSFSEIEEVMSLCAPGGTRFEFECYDIGHLYNLAHFVERGLVKPPFFVQSVFGLLGGIGAHYEDVVMMRRTADRLFGTDYVWSVLGAGSNQMRVGAIAAAIGANVRVGLEDSLWAGPGRLATSSAEQVQNVRSILHGLGVEAASADEARAILGLKGGSSVNF
ncbi:MAG: 3-keto-5-aminohexanoate cleavage protein [Janthinobacterium lividum]